MEASRERRAPPLVLYFGRAVGPCCQRCGAFEVDEKKRSWCVFLACPVGLLEVQARQRHHARVLARAAERRRTVPPPQAARPAGASP